MPRSRLIAFSLSCLLATSACVGAGDAPRAALITDSAGVRIVHNTSSRFERDGSPWRVSAEPAVVIGTVAGDEAYLFDRIMSVERLSDGRWAVADMGSSQIRYYDARGRHLQSAGRSGAGPGEFRQVMGMFRLAGDTLVVDDRRERYHLLDGMGRFAGMITNRGSFIDARTHPAGAFADGTLIAVTFSPSPQALSEPHSMTRSYSRIQLTRHVADAVSIEVLDTIRTFDTVRLVPGWRGSAQRIEFEVPKQTALLSNGIIEADPAAAEIRIFGADGDLRTIARREWTPVPVTPADIEVRREQFINMGGEDGRSVPERLLRQRADIAETWVIADHMPAFTSIAVDADDHIWLRNFVPNEEATGVWRPSPVLPTQWTVFGSDGTLLGEVELPARFLPLVFGADAVAGVYRDDADVEYVHVYEIRKS